MGGREGGVPPHKKVRNIVRITSQMLEKTVPESPHITFGALSPERPHRGPLKVSHDNVPIAVQKKLRRMQRRQRERKRKCYNAVARTAINTYPVVSIRVHN